MNSTSSTSANVEPLQYQNDKVSYVNGIWRVINWAVAENRYKNGVEGSAIMRAAI